MAELKKVKADAISHYFFACGREGKEGGWAGPVHTIGWLIFDTPVQVAQVKKSVMDIVVPKVTRARSVAVIRDGWTWFDEIPLDDLDLDYHFQPHPGFKTQQEWNEFLGSACNGGLDESKPLWRYFVVDKLPCGRSAVVCLSNHASGDGVSQMFALLSLCNKLGTNPMIFGKPSRHTTAAEKGSKEKVEREQKEQEAGKPRKLNLYEIALASVEGLSTPFLEQVLPGDFPNALKVDKSAFPTDWKVATSTPQELMDVKIFKEIKERIPGTTINDVMLAVTALTIKAYYTSTDEPIMKTSNDITATFPVNMRPRNIDYLSDKWFGNRIVMEAMTFPLHKSRIDTLLQFRDEVRALKVSPEVAVRNMLTNALGFVPSTFLVPAVVQAASGYSIMVSNVIFNLEELECFGQTVVDASFTVLSPLGFYSGMCTYKDKVNCTVILDKKSKADPEELLRLYKKELQALHKEVLATPASKLQKLDRPKQLPLLYIFTAVIVIAVGMVWDYIPQHFHRWIFGFLFLLLTFAFS